MWNVQRWWDLLRLVTNTVTSLTLITFSALSKFCSPSPFSIGKMYFQATLHEGNEYFRSVWGVAIRTWKRVLLGALLIHCSHSQMPFVVV